MAAPALAANFVQIRLSPTTIYSDTGATHIAYLRYCARQQTLRRDLSAHYLNMPTNNSK